MTDHPSTFNGYPENHGEIDWDDRAALCLKAESGGKIVAGSTLRKGTFAEMINHFMLLSEESRDRYVIKKLGDRAYLAPEILALARRAGFPGPSAN
ncbi:hypothetical protein P7228_14675 [Altererythrobacter arenosus]|uniref:Uncharacterized protein n=1 Tax=Altererythrobacter arenosus TaxID=3032592 RepID=A0ABY8FQC2_9SPHN|nr:hypothetical protein [Altererythrobacter sp. CAU 1644]WFL77216.1 hypothetical protein P7228_14675 [Altererythrobacter sp. CAU 1644]